MSNPLRVPWILLLSLNGLLLGLLTSLVGLPGWVEFAVWLSTYVVWGFIVLRGELRPFLTPLLASTLSGIWVGATQFLLREAYVENNPWYAEEIAEAGGMTAAGTIGFGVTMGIGWGVIVGGVLWAIARFRRR